MLEKHANFIRFFTPHAQCISEQFSTLNWVTMIGTNMYMLLYMSGQVYDVVNDHCYSNFLLWNSHAVSFRCPLNSKCCPRCTVALIPYRVNNVQGIQYTGR